MIRLPDTPLPDPTAEKLAALQAEIDRLEDYAERVRAADREFSKHNRADSPVFSVVRSTLGTMCCGIRRCGYCEDSCGDQIEHIRPKSLYPEAVFQWLNYLYACSNCNGPKNNGFAVFAVGTGTFTIVTRRSKAAVVAPVAGDEVLLDPRREDPMSFLEVDIKDTFDVLPSLDLQGRDLKRADYTIDLLRLNRELLRAARGNAYVGFRARLKEYATDKQKGAPRRHLADVVESLRRTPHHTIWKEMQRQHRRIPELRALFERVPEALDF